MGNIGELNERIQIATKSTTVDEIGGFTNQWTLGNEIWAKVEFRAPGSDEAFDAKQITSYTAAVFTVRFRELNEAQEIEYRSDRYQIISLLPQDKRTYLIIEARKKSPQ